VVPSKATMTLAIVAVTLVVWSRAPPAIPVMSEGVRRCSAQKLNTSSSECKNTKHGCRGTQHTRVVITKGLRSEEDAPRGGGVGSWMVCEDAGFHLRNCEYAL
jgi:hypothetical protein